MRSSGSCEDITLWKSSMLWPSLAARRSIAGVAMGPGVITLTRTPRGANSAAHVRPRLRTAALDAA
jgi:hypothetical protein